MDHGDTSCGSCHGQHKVVASHEVDWSGPLSRREDQVRRGVETILSESERAARIVRSLLTFARKRQTTRKLMQRQRGATA